MPGKTSLVVRGAKYKVVSVTYGHKFIIKVTSVTSNVSQDHVPLC